MNFQIIDFHTHPFKNAGENICAHKKYVEMDAGYTLKEMDRQGVSMICGSVIGLPDKSSESDDIWERQKMCNDDALWLSEKYKDRYIPGFHVHPDYIKESCEEIERMNEKGVRLVGELVPYLSGWKEGYSGKNMYEIWELIGQYNMVVSLHPSSPEDMNKVVSTFKNVIFIGAHPGEADGVEMNIGRMKKNDNYYLDLSAYGLHRYGMLRHLIDEVGAERILFGTDYPTCNPSAYIGAVLNDSTVSDSEKELILSKNAKRLLNI